MNKPLSERICGLLSRKTASGRFIPEIDGLRFVAVSSVVAFHLYVFVVTKLALDASGAWMARVMSKGAFGVQLFFVISGFIICLPFAQAHRTGQSVPPLAAYYRRRLTRLEPPYVLNLLLISALLLLAGKESFDDLLPHFLSSVTYTHNLIHERPSLINGVAWSLEVECQFYLVAPLLVKMFGVSSTKRRRLLLSLSIAIMTCVGEYLVPQTPRWQLSLPAHLNYFLCGFLLADLFLLEPAPEVRRTYRWDVGGTLCWLLIGGLLLGPRDLRVLLPVPLTLACYSVFRGRLSGALFGNRYLYTIGGMCYTIYLYHTYVLSLCGGMFVRVPGLAGLPVWLTLSLASLLLLPLVALTCAVLFALLEKPFMYSNWPAMLQSRLALFAPRRPAAPGAVRTPR